MVKLINPGPAISIFSTNEGIFLVLIIFFDISLGVNFNFWNCLMMHWIENLQIFHYSWMISQH